MSLDGMFIKAGMDPTISIKQNKVTLTNAQIKHIRATPITLVAAPGSLRWLEFLGAELLLDAGTNVLSESADNLAVRYTNGSGVVVSETIECTGFIDASVDTMTRAIPVKDPIVAKSACVNKALVLHNTGDGEYGANAAADATMTVWVYYRTHHV